MPIGSKYSGQVPNYVGMAQDADMAGLNEAKELGNQISQGFKLGSQIGDRHRQHLARTAYGNAWASGDPKQIEHAMQMYPEFAEQAQKFIGIRDEQHRKDTGSLMSELSALSDTGDYQGALDLVNRSGTTLDADASRTMKSMLADAMSQDSKVSGPARQKFSNLTNSMALTALTPEESAKWKTKQQSLALENKSISQRWDIAQLNNQYRDKVLQHRDIWHQNALNFRAQMTDKQQQIADRENWNSWDANNKKTITNLAQTLQAEGRMEAGLASGTPIGDMSAMMQFLVQESPNLSPRIAQAMHISTEAANGVLERVRQGISDFSTGTKLDDTTKSDMKLVGGLMKQAAMNQYYGAVSPALMGVDLTDPKQAATAMKRTNLRKPALQYIQDHADEFDQYGFGSGIPGPEGSNQPKSPPKNDTKPISVDSKGTVNPYTGDVLPKIGDVKEGYRFTGGNPADPKNWEKVNG